MLLAIESFPFYNKYLAKLDARKEKKKNHDATTQLVKLSW